ncbi:hypothetical protein H0H92_010003 [Tricholoma furcatifolium]|nr:hypothetical protein H0H92_010003 [Tricholoma furcatifolium]
MAVDIDETTQNLRFNLVTFPNSYPGLYSDAPTKGSLDIIVWRVDLCGHGTAACLEATLLHSFLATENDTGVASINLRGDLLARCMSRSTMNPHYIEVFDWRLSESSRHRRLVILLELAAYCQSVVLLPGNRLLVVCVDALFLYNVGSLTDQDPDTPLPQRPQCSEWKLAGDYEFETASHISIEDQAVSIVLTAKQTIYRLRIPQDADHPYLTRLAQASEHFRYSSVGFEKALMGTRCSFIKLSWHCSSKREDEHSLIISSRLERILSNDYIEFILDEQTGRIVVCADDIIVVLDTTAFLPVSGRY